MAVKPGSHRVKTAGGPRPSSHGGTTTGSEPAACLPAAAAHRPARGPTPARFWPHARFTRGLSTCSEGRAALAASLNGKTAQGDPATATPDPCGGCGEPLRPEAAAAGPHRQPRGREPLTAPRRHPPPGSPLPAAGRWKPMMRLIRSSEFINSFLRRSSARRWEAERPAGAPGAAAAAPPLSAIAGSKGRGAPSAPHNGASPPQRAGAGAARPPAQPLKRAPPSRVRARNRGCGRGGSLANKRSLAGAPSLKMAAPASEASSQKMGGKRGRVARGRSEPAATHSTLRGLAGASAALSLLEILVSVKAENPAAVG